MDTIYELGSHPAIRYAFQMAGSLSFAAYFVSCAFVLFTLLKRVFSLMPLITVIMRMACLWGLLYIGIPFVLSPLSQSELLIHGAGIIVFAVSWLIPSMLNEHRRKLEKAKKRVIRKPGVRVIAGPALYIVIMFVLIILSVLMAYTASFHILSG